MANSTGNDPPEFREARVSELGRAFAAALLAGDEVGAEIAVRVLALRREAHRFAASRSGRKVLLAAPAGELHVVALRMVANLLREAGYVVAMLGADIPVDALADSARRHEADVVCLSATMPGTGNQALIAVHEIQKLWPGAAFVIGGRDAMPRLRPTPGIDVCRRVSEVVESVDAMVQRADMN